MYMYALTYVSLTIAETCLIDDEIKSMSIIWRGIIYPRQYPAIHAATTPRVSSFL